ncbi:hypothetical protein P4361_20700, partial [Fictibacillus sp. B-59209]|uniref:hypothetical protein n=1 Tax=Fictibacillus sp. B-59209 TaxID=3024873 RepID=UPI002E1CD77C|nr:hypothetical protein [Fictibacillus sp. B-59209]
MDKVLKVLLCCSGSLLAGLYGLLAALALLRATLKGLHAGMETLRATFQPLHAKPIIVTKKNIQK